MIDDRLCMAVVMDMRAAKSVDFETDAALHMVLAAFPEGGTKTLAETVELLDEFCSGARRYAVDL